MYERPAQFEQPTKKEGAIGDEPLAAGKMKFRWDHMTPAANAWLAEHGINFYDYPDTHLKIVNKAIDLGRQITRGELESLKTEVEQSIHEEKEYQERASALEKGTHEDRIVDIEVLHDPSFPVEANIRIRAITENGYKVIIRRISGLDLDRKLNKKKMAEDFVKRLIGKQIKFFKMTVNLPETNDLGEEVGTRGKRVYLRIKAGTLPEFETLTYAKLKQWAARQKKDYKQ